MTKSFMCTKLLLGIEITANGSFKLAEQMMYEKAQKAFLKLKSVLQAATLTPQLSVKLFDQLLKPICTYGSEI